jgi:hypothetical protein
MILYFVHIVLVLNMQSVLYIATTEGKLNRVPYEQLSVIYTGKQIYAIFLNGENEAAL